MNKQQGFLATFRIDQTLWEKFKAIAKDKRTNASSLIIGYIEGVVSAGGVDDFGVLPVQQPESISLQDIDKYLDEKIKLLSLQQPESISLQDIDKYMDEKIKLLSVENIDLMIDERINLLHQGISSLSVQDIDKHIDDRLGGISQLIRNEIGNSLNEGDIGERIQDSRKDLVGILNDFNERLVKTEAAVIGENKLSILTTKKAKPTNTKKEPTEKDKADIIKALSIQNILSGEEKYSKNSSKLFNLVQQNKVDIESKLGIKIENMVTYPVRGFNKILKALGYEHDFDQLTVNGERISVYFVVQG